jgi:hypothetical protein
MVELAAFDILTGAQPKHRELVMGRHPRFAESIITKCQGQSFIGWKIPWSG